MLASMRFINLFILIWLWVFLKWWWRWQGPYQELWEKKQEIQWSWRRSRETSQDCLCWEPSSSIYQKSKEKCWFSFCCMPVCLKYSVWWRVLFLLVIPSFLVKCEKASFFLMNHNFLSSRELSLLRRRF